MGRAQRNPSCSAAVKRLSFASLYSSYGLWIKWVLRKESSGRIVILAMAASGTLCFMKSIFVSMTK
jgi:hypothetical protein